MTDSNLEKAFDSDGSGEKRNLRVYLINSPSENPWRTQGDYRQEQEEARNRHAMFQEQHKIILKSYRTNLIAVGAAIVAALAAVAIAYLTYQSIPEKQSIEKQQEESLQNPTTNKTK